MCELSQVTILGVPSDRHPWLTGNIGTTIHWIVVGADIATS
jgi:hypothetical protein